MTSNGITPLPNFIEIYPAVLEIKFADRLTDKISPVFLNIMHILQRTRVLNRSTFQCHFSSGAIITPVPLYFLFINQLGLSHLHNNVSSVLYLSVFRKNQQKDKLQ
jgi:hypothetical protein